MSLLSPIGTIAFVIDEEALFVKVNNGWQYIQLGSIITATTPPPTSTPPAKPPFESSNLVNSVSFPIAGPNVS